MLMGWRHHLGYIVTLSGTHTVTIYIMSFSSNTKLDKVIVMFSFFHQFCFKTTFRSV